MVCDKSIKGQETILEKERLAPSAASSRSKSVGGAATARCTSL
jgi:hypothetical protein